MSKKKTTTTQTNTFGYQKPPETPDISYLRENAQSEIDPTIPYSFAARNEQFANSYNNPFGAYTTPAVRDAATRANQDKLAQEQSVVMQGARKDAQDTTFNRRQALAAMTNPQMVQTGGTSTIVQPSNFLQNLALGGISAGGAALSGGGTAALM